MRFYKMFTEHLLKTQVYLTAVSPVIKKGKKNVHITAVSNIIYQGTFFYLFEIFHAFHTFFVLILEKAAARQINFLYI